MKKTMESSEDMDIALLSLRTTPIESNLPSPVEIIFGRKIHANLPVHFPNKSPDRDQIGERLEIRQHNQKAYHDKHVHELDSSDPGQNVMVRDTEHNTWQPAIVKEKCAEPRLYWVQTSNGNVLRRNRYHLRETEVCTQPVKKVTFAETPISN